MCRNLTLESQGINCLKCGSGEKINIDHIKPKSKYPERSFDLDNLQVLCNACNREKGYKDESDYRKRSHRDSLKILLKERKINLYTFKTQHRIDLVVFVNSKKLINSDLWVEYGDSSKIINKKHKIKKARKKQLKYNYKKIKRDKYLDSKCTVTKNIDISRILDLQKNK